MKPGKRTVLIVLIVVGSMVLPALSMAPAASEKPTSSRMPVFLNPITSDPATWLANRVDQGQDVYLSANYLFQVMKLRSQKALMEFEAATLLPTLVEVTDGIKQAGVDGDALVFVEIARKLLNPGAEVDPSVAEDVQKRLEAFMNDPRNTPRGHYATTEELKKYFRGMQFLTRAVFDVKIDQQWFSQSMYMLFPFDAAASIIGILSDPTNASLRERMDSIDDFYGRVVGVPDLPTFHDLAVDRLQLDKQAVLAYSNKKGLPRINRGMGVGVQCFGERFSLHQSVIDSMSEKFLEGDPGVDRRKAFAALRFRNILLGTGNGKTGVPGLAEVKVHVSNPGVSYYSLCLAAINAVPGNVGSSYFLNTAACSLTALAEQTILATKQSTLVVKSAVIIDEKKKKPVSIYVQPGIGKFLDHLRAAQNKLYSACGRQSVDEPYTYLVDAAGTGKPLQSDSPQGISALKFASPLEMDPTVTADVFFYSGRVDKAFLQWAIGPFEVEYTTPNNTKAVGMEMVFFEGWHDDLRKGAKTPMTNEEWRELFIGGKYKDLYSFIAGRK
jgi:hypothetical protein